MGKRVGDCHEARPIAEDVLVHAIVGETVEVEIVLYESPIDPRLTFGEVVRRHEVQPWQVHTLNLAQ